MTTGPWKLVSATADQKIFDRNDDWWGAKTGFRPVPKMKRVIVLPRMEHAKKVQVMINNDVDTTHDLFPANIPALLERDKKALFWVDGNVQPYGSVSPSTIMIGVNNSKPPFDDRTFAARSTARSIESRSATWSTRARGRSRCCRSPCCRTWLHSSTPVPTC